MGLGRSQILAVSKFIFGINNSNPNLELNPAIHIPLKKIPAIQMDKRLCLMEEGVRQK